MLVLNIPTDLGKVGPMIMKGMLPIEKVLFQAALLELILEHFQDAHLYKANPLIAHILFFEVIENIGMELIVKGEEHL
jgi:hypothetical protein